MSYSENAAATNRADWPTSEQTPLVSVIMPVRNERNAIRQTVESVLNQDYAPERLELLVADGMSNDGTREILDEISCRDPRVRVVENRKQIMATGFNIGLARAQGTIILMMGGHTQIAGDYISKCSRLLRSGIADCVGGPIETVCSDDRARGIAAAMSSRFGVGGASFRVGCARTKYVDTVAFGAYTRGVIQGAGGLDEELVRNQDDEFNYRIRKLGGRILISPELRCRYFGRSSLRALWRQYFQYGCWKVRVLQKHPRQMRPRQFAPALLVSALATSLLFASVSLVAKLLFIGTAVSYVGANLAASAMVVIANRNITLLPTVPVAFTTLHFAYGAGSLVGLLRFWHCWRSEYSVPATLQN